MLIKVFIKTKFWNWMAPKHAFKIVRWLLKQLVMRLVVTITWPKCLLGGNSAIELFIHVKLNRKGPKSSTYSKNKPGPDSCTVKVGRDPTLAVKNYFVTWDRFVLFLIWDPTRGYPCCVEVNQMNSNLMLETQLNCINSSC